MIVTNSIVKDYLQNIEINKKYFIAIPHSTYFLIQKKDLQFIDIFYREELVKKFNLTSNEQWNCAKYAEAYKTMANIYYYNFFRESPRSLAIGNIYYAQKNEKIKEIKTPWISEIGTEEKYGGHVANIILYHENKIIKHLYRDHFRQEFNLNDIEKKYLELIIM